MQMVEVITTAAHTNSYGDDYSKAEGDVYTVPLDVARSLKRDGLIDFEEPEAAADQSNLLDPPLEP